MDRTIKACVAIGILLVGIAVSYYFAFALPAVQKGRLATQAAEKQLEQVQKCSARAKEFFKDSQFSEKDSGASYENHFNIKLNKCLVFVEQWSNSGGNVFHYKAVLDANEGNYLGHYVIKVGRGDEPLICRIFDKDCQTDKEFEDFLKSYMER